MGNMEESWGLYGKIAIVLIVTGTVISLASYVYYTAYVILYSLGSLPPGITEVIPFFTPTKNLLALIAVAILVVVVFSILIYAKRGPFSRISSANDTERYSIYAVVYISAMIMVSLIFSSFVTSTANYNSIVLNFQEQIGVITLTFVLQIVPITVFSAILSSRSSAGIRAILMGEKRLASREAGIVFAVTLAFDAVLLYFFVDTISGYADWLILFAASNVLYIKFGFWRAYLANFIYTALLVISYALLYSYSLSIAFEILIFVWIFIGLMMLTSAGTASYARKRQEELANRQFEEKPQLSAVQSSTSQEVAVPLPESRISSKMKLWVKGGCPSCGNPGFSADRNATLTCLKCGREIGTDEIHPHNIEIKNGRVFVTMQRDSNEDLYS